MSHVSPTQNRIRPGSSNIPDIMSFPAPSSIQESDTFDPPIQGKLTRAVDNTGRNPITSPANESTRGNESEAHSATYIGRSYYIGEGTTLDESLARSYTPAKLNGLSHVEMETLRLWRCFDIPPKPVRQSLMECFMEYCYPWMPTMSSSELQQGTDKFESLLLMQSMFLAASRLSLSPSIVEYATSEQFYHRAKALFWTGHEKNPLTVIESITMLHWYNPDGPAYVSYDASEFWLKIGVGLAFQIGLHKEPPKDYLGRALRRRVWWSLVVSTGCTYLRHLLNLQRFVTLSSLSRTGGHEQSSSTNARRVRHVKKTSQSPASKESFSSHM